MNPPSVDANPTPPGGLSDVPRSDFQPKPDATVPPPGSPRDNLSQIFENEPLYSTLRQSIIAEAVDRFEDRHSRHRNLYLTLGGLAIGLVGALLTFIVDQLLDSRVQRNFDENLERQLGALTFASRVAPLNAEVLAIDRDDGVDAQAAERLIEQVQSLYQSFASPEAVSDTATLENVIANRQQLIFAVQTLVTNLAAAGLDNLVERLTEVAPELIASNNSVSTAMVQYYGRRLLEAPAGAAAWTNPQGAEQETFVKYRTYANRARTGGFPELYLLYESLLRFSEGRPEQEMIALVRDIDDLSDRDRPIFIDVFTSLANEGYKREPDSATHRLASQARLFLNTYGGHSETLAFISRILPPLREL